MAQVELPGSVREAIVNILYYNWDDEEEDFEECKWELDIEEGETANHKDGHIFLSLQSVANWLKSL